MKKNFFKFLLLGAFTLSLGAGFVGCKDYDDPINNLQEQIDELNKSLAGLQADIDAGKLITNVASATNGFTITFSDGTSYTITNGADGAKGADGKDGAKGADGKTPYVTIEDGNWVVYPNGKGTSEKEVLGSAKGEKGDKGDNGAKGDTGANGSYVTVTEDGDGNIIIATFAGDGTAGPTYKVPSTGDTMVAVETDYYVQFTATVDGELVTYRIGKQTVIPTTIKILTPVLASELFFPTMEGKEDETATATLKISVSPSHALVNTDLIYIDSVGVGTSIGLPEGWAERYAANTRVADPDEFNFDAAGYINIESVTAGAREGEYDIEISFTKDEDKLDHYAKQMYFDIWQGVNFDVCLAFVKNPASINSVSDGSAPFVVDYGYSRSVNSFTFTDEEVEYNEGDAVFVPTKAEGNSASTGAQWPTIMFKGDYDPKFIEFSAPESWEASGPYAITAIAYTAGGEEIKDVTEDIKEYVSISAPYGRDGKQLEKWAITVAKDGEGFADLAEEEASFVPGSYVQIKIETDVYSSYDWSTDGETLTYTYDIYYVKTRADLTANSTQWLPNNSDGYAFGEYSAIDVIHDELGFPADATLALDSWTVKAWDAEAATPAWVASETTYFTAALAEGKIAPKLTWSVQPGIYEVTYKVVADGINTFLVQRVNVVIPDYNIALQEDVVAGYVAAVDGPPAVAAHINYYADSADAVVKVEDVLNGASIAAVKPASDGAIEVDSQNFPAVTGDVPVYQYATEGHMVGANSYGLVSAPAELSAIGTGTFKLSVKLKSGQSLPVYVDGSTDYFTNDVNVKINQNAVVAESIAFDVTYVSAGTFQTEVHYTAAKTTAVDLRDVIQSVNFTNTLGTNYVETPTAETVEGKTFGKPDKQTKVSAYYYLMGMGVAPAAAAGDPKPKPDDEAPTYLPKDTRVASVDFVVGDIALVSAPGQLPPNDVLPLFEVVDGQLKALDRDITAADPIYQTIEVVITDVWGNKAEAEFKVHVIFD